MWVGCPVLLKMFAMFRLHVPAGVVGGRAGNRTNQQQRQETKMRSLSFLAAAAAAQDRQRGIRKNTILPAVSYQGVCLNTPYETPTYSIPASEFLGRRQIFGQVHHQMKKKQKIRRCDLWVFNCLIQ